jgi:hypothetical protein
MHLRFRSVAFVATLALLLAPVALTGCDTITQALGIDRVDVSTGSAGQLTVGPGVVVHNSQTVTISQNLPGSVRVNDIQVLAENLSYAPAPGARSGASQQTCPVDVWVLVNNVRAVEGTVVVQDEPRQVVSHTFRFAQPYQRATLCAALPLAEGELCPLATGDKSQGEIQTVIDQALRSGSFTIDFLSRSEGDCTGLLSIQRLRYQIGT